MTPHSLRSLLPWLLGGCALSYASGWEPNAMIATWLVPLALLWFSRRAPSGWQAVLLPFAGLTVAGWFTVRGAWHMGATTELFFSAVMALPLTGSLLADRLTHPRLGPLPRTLVFPVTWVCFDFVYSHMYGLGDVFSPALTQFHMPVLVQLVSLTGIYGITFLMGWFATIAVGIGEHPHNLPAWRTPVVAYLAVMLGVLTFGSARLTGFDHEVPTVRIAGIVVPHDSDYHDEIVDQGSPRADSTRWQAELAALEERLFEASAQAAAAGAKVLVWSETGAVMYEDHEETYLRRASTFARDHGVYLQTTALVAHYDSDRVDNQLTLFQPDGTVAYSYLKTQTWYPTESDGIIHSVDTPFGRIASVICFDLDNPAWMRQVADMGADILLVPGFDTLAISPYHTEAGLFRAVEGGYSLVRPVNDGTSMAVDPRGRVLALQDSFRSPEPILYVDVPTRGERTLYGALGDWLPLATLASLFALLGLAWRRPIRRETSLDLPPQ